MRVPRVPPGASFASFSQRASLFVIHYTTTTRSVAQVPETPHTHGGASHEGYSPFSTSLEDELPDAEVEESMSVAAKVEEKKKQRNEQADATCPICHEKYGEGLKPEPRVKLNCEHAAGLDCLRSWIMGYGLGKGVSILWQEQD